MPPAAGACRHPFRWPTAPKITILTAKPVEQQQTGSFYRPSTLPPRDWARHSPRALSPEPGRTLSSNFEASSPSKSRKIWLSAKILISCVSKFCVYHDIHLRQTPGSTSFPHLATPKFRKTYGQTRRSRSLRNLQVTTTGVLYPHAFRLPKALVNLQVCPNFSARKHADQPVSDFGGRLADRGQTC